jgi:hypothetical protein
VLILFLGDTHCGIGVVNALPRVLAARGLPVDLLVQVGDFGFFDSGPWPHYLAGEHPFEVPTIVVPGNHEMPTCVDRVAGPMGSVLPNFQCVDPEGRQVEFTKNGETISLLCVPGAKCVDNPPEGFYMPFDPDVYERVGQRWELAGRPPVDFLVTHDCPRSVGMQSNPEVLKRLGKLPIPGEPKLSALWELVRPRLQVNGHHHRWHEATSKSGLAHLTLPLAQKGFAVFDTETNRYERFTTNL